MLKFSTPILFQNVFYSNYVRLFKTPPGIVASILLLGASALNIYVFFVYYDLASLILGIALIAFFYFIVPYVRYKRYLKVAKAKEITYFFDQDHFGYELGITKNVTKLEAIKSIKIYPKYLLISLKNTWIKAIMLFPSTEQKPISDWLHKSPYKDLLKN